MPQKLSPANRKRGTHRSIYFQYRDMDMLENLEALVCGGRLGSLSDFVLRAVRAFYIKEYGE